MKLCPKCKVGKNSKANGGNKDCFHCGNCSYVECETGEVQPSPPSEWEEKLNELGFIHPPLHAYIRKLLATARREEREKIKNIVMDNTKYEKNSFEMAHDILLYLDSLTEQEKT